MVFRPKMVCSSIFPLWSRFALGAIPSNELGRGHRLSQRPSRLPAGTTSDPIDLSHYDFRLRPEQSDIGSALTAHALAPVYLLVAPTLIPSAISDIYALLDAIFRDRHSVRFIRRGDPSSRGWINGVTVAQWRTLRKNRYQ